MTHKPKRDSRHITLKPEALKIYDQWKVEGEASKVSDAIIEKHARTTGTDIETRLRAVERWIERWEKEGKKDV